MGYYWEWKMVDWLESQKVGWTAFLMELKMVAWKVGDLVDHSGDQWGVQLVM